jgi:hypothetical protein
MCREEEKEMAIAQRMGNEKLSFMDDIKSIIRKNMKKKGISPAEARKSLGIKKYEKK